MEGKRKETQVTSINIDPAMLRDFCFMNLALLLVCGFGCVTAMFGTKNCSKHTTEIRPCKDVNLFEILLYSKVFFVICDAFLKNFS
jgi:hypothetical protein